MRSEGVSLSFGFFRSPGTTSPRSPYKCADSHIDPVKVGSWGASFDGASCSASCPSGLCLAGMRGFSRLHRTDRDPTAADRGPDVGGAIGWSGRRGCNDTVINAPPAPGAGRALAANPWVELGVPGNAVVAYFFSPRSPFLTAGASLPPTVRNKILWVEEDPTGGDLLIVANPSGATKPSVQLTVPPAGSPRGTYPSIVSLPTPGCWHLAVTWASGRGSIDLVVGAP
jgi:hypothetical protein